MKTITFKIIPYIILILPLSSCLPVALTTATVSVAKLSKNQTTGQIIDDNIIATKIKAAFIKRGFSKLYTKITVSVNSGRVLYVGTVIDQQDVLDAMEIAWNIRGVKEVINELEISTVDIW